MDVDPRLQGMGVNLGDFNFQPQQFVQHYPVYDSNNIHLNTQIAPNSQYVQDSGYFQGIPQDGLPPHPSPHPQQQQQQQSQQQRQDFRQRQHSGGQQVRSQESVASLPNRNMSNMGVGGVATTPQQQPQTNARMALWDPFRGGQRGGQGLNSPVSHQSPSSTLSPTTTTKTSRAAQQKNSLPTPSGDVHTHSHPNRRSVQQFLGTASDATQRRSSGPSSAISPPTSAVAADKPTTVASKLLDHDPTSFTAPHLARPLVPNPPNLDEWRNKFFNIKEPLLLTSEEYHTYFPHIDNVYSHRSTQKYKKKPFVSHYWDCRLKGRPTGTPMGKRKKDKDTETANSADEGPGGSEKKKRKRKVRERDLCDVKIKVTEFFGRDELEVLGKLGLGPDGNPVSSHNTSNAGNIGEEGTGGGGTGTDMTFSLEDARAASNASNGGVGVGVTSNGTDMPFGVLEPMKKFPEGHPGAGGKRWYMVQRVSGNDTGDKDKHGSDLGAGGDKDLDHKHTLEESDRIKKNSVQRWLLTQEKEKKKQAKVKGTADATATGSPVSTSNRSASPPSRFHASGRAEQTLKLHSTPASSQITLFINSFCPFGQRVWIALELIGIPYQYVECTEKQMGDGKCILPELLEVNPEGQIPAIRHGNFCVWESNVMIEYLEDLAMGHSLYPVGNPQLKAHSRLWTDHINRKILPPFYSLLLTPKTEAGHEWQTKTGVPALSERRSMFVTILQEAITKLVNASHRTGPFFLGDQLSYVDVTFAPWILRLSRVLSYYRDFPRPEVGTRWQMWVDAIEMNEVIQRTVSDERSYHNIYGGVCEDTFDGTLDGRRSFAEIRLAKMMIRQEGFGLGGDIWGHIHNEMT